MKIEDLLLQISNGTQYNQEQNFSGDYTALVIAIATIALVLVTIYYARQTKHLVTNQKESVDAMKESTRAQFRPHIQVDFVFRQTLVPLIVVSNAGKGAAVSIEIKYKIKEIDTDEKVNIIPRLDKGDIKKIFLDSEGNKKNRTTNWYRENQTTLSVKWKCYDILRNKFEDADEINVSQLLSQRENEYEG